MYNVQSHLYYTVELFDMYTGHSGLLSLKHMFAKFGQYLADDIMVIRCDGCATLVGFKGYVSKTLKLVKANTNEEDSEAVSVIHQIKKEAKDLTKSSSFFYDLGNFTHQNTVSQTSPILLRVVSALVSNDVLTKQSFSLAQSIQSHIAGCHSQTTLGLAVKIHHKHGIS